MASLPGLPSDVYFGSPQDPLPDWRKELGREDDEPTDDDVAEMLGFDPDELDDNDSASEGTTKGFDRIKAAGELLWNGKSNGEFYP